VPHRNSLAKTVVVFRTFGNVIAKMIAEMEAMREISVLKKLVLTSNLRVLELAIVYLNLGYAMVMMIVSVKLF
jgi:hypothetical protein